ncbi:MAG: hypothetical protein NTU49_02310 [Gammaproteobacteria bacterium]|nr:hypothetical protein [Gammaproteobacteria bacterium]
MNKILLQAKLDTLNLRVGENSSISDALDNFLMLCKIKINASESVEIKNLLEKVIFEISAQTSLGNLSTANTEEILYKALSSEALKKPTDETIAIKQLIKDVNAEIRIIEARAVDQSDFVTIEAPAPRM